MAATLSKELVWVSASNGEVADDAVVGGYAEDGSTFYIARAFVDSKLAMGSVRPGGDCAYLPSCKKVVRVSDYEILCNRGGVKVAWVPASASGNVVPTGAVVGGSDAKDLPIYVARCHHNGTIVPGKLVVFYSVAFIAWDDEEIWLPQYEVLCVKRVAPQSSGRA